MARRVVAVSVVDAVGDDLRRRLFAGELVALSSVTEAQVAEEYEVSRPSARAAIEKLTSEGLLQRGPHRSARVPELTASDVRDIYRTRLRLESVAVRELADERKIPESAREANGRLCATVAGYALASVEPDMQFHTSLVDAVGSPRLGRMYRSLVDEVRLCMAQVQGRNLLSVELIAREHEKILDLIELGDADAAIACLHEHLGRASDRLAESLERPRD